MAIQTTTNTVADALRRAADAHANVTTTTKGEAQEIVNELKIHQTTLSAVQGCGPFGCAPCRSTYTLSAEDRADVEQLAEDNLNEVSRSINELSKDFKLGSSMTKPLLGAAAAVVGAGIVHFTGAASSLFGRVSNILPSIPAFFTTNVNSTLTADALQFGANMLTKLTPDATTAATAASFLPTLGQTAIGIGVIGVALAIAFAARSCFKEKQA